MSCHYFLFTYSVSVAGSHEVELADKVRRKIAKLEQWKKLERVETAFSGELYLIADTVSAKRKEAQSDVKEAINKIVDDSDALNSVYVNVALLVDGLGEYIEFRF